MTKRRPAFNPAQLAFSFAAPQPAIDQASLAGLERVLASAVSRVLKEDPRTRFEIAAAVSQLLDEDVSKAMLDAYSAEAKDTHNISASRFLALIAVTGRFDVLDATVSRIGCKVLVGEEIYVAELGHLDRQIDQLQKRKRLIQAQAQPIKRGLVE